MSLKNPIPNSENLLLIFVKNPEKGKVKTRLAKTIGDDKALEVYRFLTKHTQKITEPIDADIRVSYSGILGTNDDWTGMRYEKDIQYQGDLGARMMHAFTKAFEDGYKRVAIIGSDCYDLTTTILEDAFNALRTNDAVVGPALDGGYYLIGMNQLYPYLFEKKEWSTEEVYPATIIDFQINNLSHHILPALSDIDYEEDLLKTDILEHLK